MSMVLIDAMQRPNPTARRNHFVLAVLDLQLFGLARWSYQVTSASLKVDEQSTRIVVCT